MTAAAVPKLPQRCYHRFGSSRVCILGRGWVLVLEKTSLAISLISESG